jgi:hypothetical protein
VREREREKEREIEREREREREREAHETLVCIQRESESDHLEKKNGKGLD